MPDIQILTADKIGDSFTIDPYTGNVSVRVSNDPKNMLKVDPSHGLVVNGAFVETVPNSQSIVWTHVEITDPNLHTGMADYSNPLQIGKDLKGNIWMRGAVTNIGSQVAANSIWGTIPVDWHLGKYNEDYSFVQLNAVQSSVGGNTAALFLRMQNYSYVQSLAFSANMPVNASFIMQPTIIGLAKFGFKAADIVEEIPTLADVTWTDIAITNVNVATGFADSSFPLQIGKDTKGNIWMRGAVTNIASAVAANGVIATLPTTHQLSGYTSINSFCQLVPIQSTLPGNTTALFLRMKNYNNVQTLAFSGSLASSVSFVLQPTIIGRALTP